MGWKIKLEKPTEEELRFIHTLLMLERRNVSEQIREYPHMENVVKSGKREIEKIDKLKNKFKFVREKKEKE